MRLPVVASLVVTGACGGSAAPPPNTTLLASPRVDIPMSDPHEYAIDRISRDAGKAIFERTGIGDPYRTGVPYPIFLALLAAFPDVFGADTAELAGKFGLIPRAADPASKDPDLRAGLPVGMHLTIDPITNVPFVVNNCTMCHAEKLRWRGVGDEHDREALVIGLGNKRVRVHAYDRAYSEIVKRPQFTADKLGRLAAEAAATHQITWPDEYRAAFIGAAMSELTKRAAQRAELHTKTSLDPPGRVATIESFTLVLGQLTGKQLAYAPIVGWAKVPDVIGYGQRTTLSWDGSGEGPIDLLAVEADVAAGVRIEWLEAHPFQGASLGAYLRQPAKRPAFPGSVDRAKAERGRVAFEEHCRGCHGHYAPDGRVLDYDEAIIPIEDLGVDPARMMAATEEFERAANDPKLTRGYTKFRRSKGYVPPVLTNVWARAPYGHAGQWPTLAVLATAPARRPAKFVVTDGLYDLAGVGVPWSASSQVSGFVHDGAKPGFSTLGHPFLADLGADAGAVIEYLKTL
ncbi:MAG: hypothetical protein H0V17_23965 [Deltaproteobacteria bacterium]|nr:hypothetical protein [Deltaproteobacteria bacterium]